MKVIKIGKNSYTNMIENAVTSHISHLYSNTKTIKYPNLQDRQIDSPNTFLP